jgi:type IV secretory pathway VirB3-like protein
MVMTTLQDYALPVHKSLHQPDLLLGVTKMIVAIILCVTVLFIYLLGPIYALVGVVFYIPCYLLSREDPQLLTIALESLFQMDILEG